METTHKEEAKTNSKPPIKKLIILLTAFLVALLLLFWYFVLREESDTSSPLPPAPVSTPSAEESSTESAEPEAEEGQVEDKQKEVILTNISAGEVIQSPLLIKGQALGSYFFEGEFPVKLYDANKQLVAESFARAQENWMTADLVSFTGTLEFDTPKTSEGTLVFEKSNPSGLPEHAGKTEIEVLFSN